MYSGVELVALRKRIRWTFVGSLLAVAAIYLATQPAPRKVEEESYVVYSAYLCKNFASDPLIAVSDKTGRWSDLRRFRFHLHKLQSSQTLTATNFLLRNALRRTLKRRFGLPQRYELLPAGNLEGKGLASVLPEAYGHVELSSGGFNRDMSQALFYIDHFCGLCGGGRYVLMEKRNGSWNVVAEAWTWIS